MIVVLGSKWNVREDRVRYFAVTSHRLVTAVTAPWWETTTKWCQLRDAPCRYSNSSVYGVSWNKGHQPDARIHFHLPVRRHSCSQWIFICYSSNWKIIWKYNFLGYSNLYAFLYIVLILLNICENYNRSKLIFNFIGACLICK